MSYVSLLKNIPEILGQPTGIAAIASLGIHGAIALIVPLMPVDSSKSNEASQKSVGVLELSQADQSRLPQSPTTNQAVLSGQVALQSQFPQPPQFAQQPQLNNIPNFNAQTTALPPLPPPITAPISLPPIYTTPNNYRIATLPRSQSLRQLPRRDFGFDNPGLNAPGDKFTPTTPPSFNETEVVPQASKPLPVDKLPELNAAQLPNDLPPNLPSNTTSSATDSTNDVANVAPIQTQVAPIGQTPQTGDNLAFAGESIPKWQQGSTLRTPELPLENSEQRPESGLIAKVNSYEDLRKALQQEYPNSQEKAVIRTTVPAEKPGIEGTVLGFLVVDTEGKVLDIKFQDKTISRDLASKAREYFAKNAPKGDRLISRYPFSLRIQSNTNNTAATEDKNPTVVITKPTSTPTLNGTQPAPLPITTPQPLLKLPLREATPKPSTQLQIRKEQPAQTPNVEASSEPTSGKNQLSSTVESSQTLLEKLREARQQQQQRQDSNSSER